METLSINECIFMQQNMIISHYNILLQLTYNSGLLNKSNINR